MKSILFLITTALSLVNGFCQDQAIFDASMRVEMKKSIDSLSLINKHNHKLILLYESDSIKKSIKDVHLRNSKVLKKISTIQQKISQRKKHSRENGEQGILSFESLNKEFNGSIYISLNSHMTYMYNKLGRHTFQDVWDTDEELKLGFDSLSLEEELNFFVALEFSLIYFEKLILERNCNNEDCILSIRMKLLQNSLKEFSVETKSRSRSLIELIEEKVKSRGSNSEEQHSSEQAKHLHEISDSLILFIEEIKKNQFKNGFSINRSKTDTISGYDLTMELDEYIQELSSIYTKTDSDIKSKRLLTLANQLNTSSTSLIDYIEGLKSKLLEKSGGLDANGTPVGMKNTDVATELFLGVSGSTPEGIELTKRLNVYIEELNFIYNEVSILSGNAPQMYHYSGLALSGSEDPQFKNNPEFKDYTFIELSFKHTPMIAALAFLTERQSKIATYNTEVLSLMNTYLDQ